MMRSLGNNSSLASLFLASGIVSLGLVQLLLLYLTTVDETAFSALDDLLFEPSSTVCLILTGVWVALNAEVLRGLSIVQLTISIGLIFISVFNGIDILVPDHSLNDMFILTWFSMSPLSSFLFGAIGLVQLLVKVNYLPALIRY